MPRTRECDYCGADIEPGTGTMYVRTNGATTHFCSAKCEKNANLGREARDLEWTEAEPAQAATEGTTGSQEDVTESGAGDEVEVEGDDVDTQATEAAAAEDAEGESIEDDEDVPAGSEEVESDEGEGEEAETGEEADTEEEEEAEA